MSCAPLYIDMALTISSAFESGSIEVVDASTPSNILLRLVPEPHSELEDATFMQWFHFSVRLRRLAQRACG